MIFSDRVLFLHVPKAGGSSLVRHLMDVLPKPVHYSIPVDHHAEVPEGVVRFDGIAHESLEEARHVLSQRGRRLEDFAVVVACVRNPYDLEVSRYSFLRSDLNPYNHGPQQALALLGDFELFACCARPHGRRPLESYYLLEGEVPPNLRIVRLESVERDLGDALAEAGVDGAAAAIPHHNRSREDDPFHGYYTAAAEQAVYEKYRWVFDAGLYPRLQVDGDPAPGFDDAAHDPASHDGDEFARANAWLAVAELHRCRGRAEAQDTALERAFEHALRVGSDRLVTRIADELARCVSLAGRGTVEEGIARCAALAEATRGTWGGGGAKLVLAELLAASGRFDEARSLCEEVRDANPRLALAAASYAGSVELLAGDAGAAAARFDEGWWTDQNVAADRAEALCRLERYDEVERIARFVETTAAAGDARAQARWRRLRAKLLARSGDLAAVELARSAVSILADCDAPNLHADALADLAEVLARTGDARGSTEALDAALDLYERKGNVAKLRSSTPASPSAARTAGSQSVASSTARSSR